MVGERVTGATVIEENNRDGGYVAVIRTRVAGDKLDIAERVAVHKAEIKARGESGYMPHEIGRVEHNILETNDDGPGRDEYIISVVVVRD